MLIMVLSAMANVSVSQCIALFFGDPLLSLGIFIILISYFTVFVFFFSFEMAYIFPNLLSAFAITQQFNFTRLYHPHHDPHFSFTCSILLIQTISYLTLASIILYCKTGKAHPSSAP